MKTTATPSVIVIGAGIGGIAAAALALKGGTCLRQFQQMLGQASITTTEWYLEPMRSLQVTAGDFIQIELALAR